MIAAAHLAADPPLGWVLSAVLFAGLLLGALGGRRRWPRLLVALAALPLLVHPVRSWVEREQPRPVAIALVDGSASMGLERRAAEAEAALAALRAADPRVDWRVTRVPPRPGEGTRLEAPLAAALGAAPAGRLGAVVLLSDGALADEAQAFAMPAGVPLHLLLAGSRDAPDRRLVIVRAPRFTPVGDAAAITLRVDGGTGAVPVRWSIDGRPGPTLSLTPGAERTVRVPVTRRGRVEVAFEAAALAQELTTVNNRALVTLSGVRERLRVLLVSGAPYPGGRVWRDLLKSDGNIELTHFTILRLPSSFDLAPPDALALIPFPVEQLFSERLPGFDLVIFDRFALSSLIGPGRLANVADYVRGGGALLVASGEEFGTPDGLSQSPLTQVLPGRASGPPLVQPFRPALAADGRSHPVTAPLPGWGPGGEAWGRWPGMARVTPVPGSEVLMAGAGDAPLLLIHEAGRGRVAFLASTGLWWWARDVAGAGPRDLLLQRLVHWLMREPELEARTLSVTPVGNRLRIGARGRPAPPFATVRPAGEGAATTVPLKAGVGLSAPLAPGFYRVAAGGLVRVALVGDRAEFDSPQTRPGPAAAAAEASGGAVSYLADGPPTLRRVAAGAPAFGAGWIGVRESATGAIRAAGTTPLIPAAVAWALLAAALAHAWWRERT